MSDHHPRTRSQRLSIVYGILVVVVILVVMQLWLLTATMNAFLGGNHAIVWPAAVASLVCLRLECRPAALPGSARSLMQ